MLKVQTRATNIYNKYSSKQFDHVWKKCKKLL